MIVVKIPFYSIVLFDIPIPDIFLLVLSHSDVRPRDSIDHLKQHEIATHSTVL